MSFEREEDIPDAPERPVITVLRPDANKPKEPPFVPPRTQNIYTNEMQYNTLNHSAFDAVSADQNDQYVTYYTLSNLKYPDT
jgi:hypothetical protein